MLFKIPLTSMKSPGWTANLESQQLFQKVSNYPEKSAIIPKSQQLSQKVSNYPKQLALFPLTGWYTNGNMAADYTKSTGKTAPVPSLNH
ncbi:hypothetical protein J9317_04135 [Metabacillus sp. KIGAM252]|uniref:Uncharacterized protein n=1 Tax=Metabacillus flavus TaxID=2823519 RepID=A0ABS5LBD8_9BACI|nr:hypothetical protein [Metabacillus flavus]MBS2967964.1 hypothetical protein [Metabacillus flavus]